MNSKRYKKLPEKTNLEKPQTIDNLIPIVKKNCTTKFDESIDSSNFVVQFFLTTGIKLLMVSGFLVLEFSGNFLNLFDDINL